MCDSEYDLQRHPVVNITPGLFYQESGVEASQDTDLCRAISAVIKKYPGDFEVFEVSDESNGEYKAENVVDVASMKFSSCDDSVELLPCPHPTKANAVNKANERPLSTENTADDEFSVSCWLQSLPGNVVERLNSMNSQASEKIGKESIAQIDVTGIELPGVDLASRRRKSLFYQYMRVRYPFLVAKSKSDGSDNISIELDLSLHHLASLGLPHEDIRLLYSFIKSGPQQTDSDGSICVGSGISRDARTLVYRALVEVAPRVDSKTITYNGVKCMRLYWKPPRSNKKRKAREVDTNIDNSGHGVSDLENSSNPIHVWFTLLKYNLEQQEASRRLSTAVGVPIGQVSTAGIKDRRGITCQRCCITVYPRDFAPFDNLQQSLFHIRDQLLMLNSPPMLDLVKEYLENEKFGRRAFAPSKDIIGMAIGNVEFRRNTPLKTGDLWGNKFRITLREIKPVQGSFNVLKHVCDSLDALKASGFPNYFGSQRMGVLTKRFLWEDMEYERENGEKHVSIINDSQDNWVQNEPKSSESLPPGPMIGKFLLTDQARFAVNSIVIGSSSDIAVNLTDDAAPGFSSRSSCVDQARHLFKVHFADENAFASHSSKASIKERLQQILNLFPASCSRECDLLRGLIRNAPVLSFGVDIASSSSNRCSLEFDEKWTHCCTKALQALSYGIKQLWVCSYQSWLWNRIANFALFDCTSAKSYPNGRKIAPADGDVVYSRQEENSVQPKHTVIKLDGSADLLSSFSVQDVVLPSIGKHMIYPENDVGMNYMALLASEGLIDHCERGQCTCRNNNMSSSGKCSISCQINGGLAHLFRKTGSCLGITPRGSYRHLLAFHNGGSVEVIEDQAAAETNIQLGFSLPSGCYATSFLRELLNNDELI